MILPSSWSNKARQEPKSFDLQAMYNNPNFESNQSRAFKCHDVITNYICKYCNFVTDLRITWNNHIWNEHQNRKTDYEIRKHICKNCDFTSHSVLVLYLHESNCVSEKLNFNSLSPDSIPVVYLNYTSKKLQTLEEHELLLQIAKGINSDNHICDTAATTALGNTMEDKRARGKNFSEYEKNVLFEHVIARYKDIIECKQTDAVTIAQKNLAWQKITQEFNAQNRTGLRTAKQLHALYDNLRKAARKNLRSNRHNVHKTGDGKLLNQNSLLDQKIVSTVKDQSTNNNKYDSSTAFIGSQPSCSYSTMVNVSENYATIGNTYVVIPMIEESPTTNEVAETVESVSEDNSLPIPSQTNYLQEDQQTDTNEKRKTSGVPHDSLPPKRKKNWKRLCQRKNFIRKHKVEILVLEKEIKWKQLAILEQQLENEKILFEIKLQNEKEKLEYERKVRDTNLKKLFDS